jgi:hypothetical protein
MPRPIDPAREAARARGDKRYIAARVCPRGHFERYVISAGCCKCADIKRAERLGKPVKARAKGVPHQVSTRQHGVNVAAAKTRFNRPPFTHALANYQHSPEGRQRSKYLDSLIRKVSR